MHIAKRCFSKLPDLSGGDITGPLEYCLSREWAISLEYAYKPHLRGAKWEKWGTPMFYLQDPSRVTKMLEECRKAHPLAYIRINAFDPERECETALMSFVAHRPGKKAEVVALHRAHARGRTQTYASRLAD